MIKEPEIPTPHFDLAMTLNSGQVFHWERVGAGFCGTIGDRAAYVEQQGDILRGKVASISSQCLAEYAHGAISHYFALDHPLDEIHAGDRLGHRVLDL